MIPRIHPFPSIDVAGCLVQMSQPRVGHFNLTCTCICSNVLWGLFERRPGEGFKHSKVETV